MRCERGAKAVWCDEVKERNSGLLLVSYASTPHEFNDEQGIDRFTECYTFQARAADHQIRLAGTLAAGSYNRLYGESHPATTADWRDR
jgi:hypothetical protein